jgi:multisubunit Na+/H+ antiporter MnhB subunit
MMHFLLALLFILLTITLGYIVLSSAHTTIDLQQLVVHNISSSGVTNPVTAVLLNFRGYDTFLEMLVLFVALLGVWSIQETPIQSTRDIQNPVLKTLVGVLVPVAILVCVYLLWVGAYAPGGAFQAGSVLGAALVLILLSGQQVFSWFKGVILRLTLVVGVTLFVLVALYSTLLTNTLLQYPIIQAKSIIFSLESMATISIGLTLSLLFYEVYTKQELKK